MKRRIDVLKLIDGSYTKRMTPLGYVYATMGQAYDKHGEPRTDGTCGALAYAIVAAVCTQIEDPRRAVTPADLSMLSLQFQFWSMTMGTLGGPLGKAVINQVDGELRHTTPDGPNEPTSEETDALLDNFKDWADVLEQIAADIAAIIR